MALRVGFMGTPDFALVALQSLHAAGHDIVCVYTQPPRPKGRGQQVQPSPVQAFAEKHAIPVFHPQSLKSADVQAEFAAQNLDVAVVAAYGLLLPRAVLEAPKFGCINIHASLLPRWRGASPIQRAIWAGDAQSGVTLMQMDAGLDTGAEIMKRAVDLNENTTATSLHDALAILGGEMIVEALGTLARTGAKLPATAQAETGVTYAALLTKNDGRVNFSQTAAEIDRQIRALNPWPGVWTMIHNKRLKILAAQKAAQKSDAPAGTILDNQGHIVCGAGTVLKLLKIQPENTKPMDFASALNGGYIKIGDQAT